ncbi:ERI1 exoribonuclease 2 [Striga asiatica]|uniref:ERI1 exoribonuclease 2 n=1 Tax=Striga asiatica TaxID=4170 RepID=A0A5A7RD07_STRAF|nr:ERI1 exoribonuclease 2 [Striga asiatica]
MVHEPPMCSCGGGRMYRFMAKTERNYGKYFYCCLEGKQHPGSFVWNNHTTCSRESESTTNSSIHATRGSNYSSTSYVERNTIMDRSSLLLVACPFVFVDEHFQFIQEGFSNKWRTAAEEKFCTILLHFIQSEGMNSEAGLDMAFEKIYHTCLADIDANLTFKECYVTFMVLKDRYQCVNGVFDIHAKTVYLDEDDREEAYEFWPLAHHYCNNPEPLWENLKIISNPTALLISWRRPSESSANYGKYFYRCPEGKQHQGVLFGDNHTTCSRESGQTFSNAESTANSSRHTSRGSNYSSTSHVERNNIMDRSSLLLVAFPFCTQRMNISNIYEKGFSNKWRTAAKEKFCTILLYFIQSEGMNSEANVDMAFEKIYHTCLAEIDPNLTCKECYVTFMFWPLAHHYCNNPEPLWETLKIISNPYGFTHILAKTSR